MENKEHLSEERYQKIRKLFLVLAIAGIILFCVGIGILIKGSSIKVPEMRADDWFEKSKERSMTMFAGGTCMMFGVFIAIVGFMSYYRRAIKGYIAQESMPVYTEAINKGASKITPAIQSVVGAAKTTSIDVNTKEKELEKASQMRNKGTITEQEYQELRRKILGIDK